MSEPNDVLLAGNAAAASREEADRQADWPRSPRALSVRGLAITLAVALFAVVVAVASIYARRTHLERTTRLLGPDAIFALQYGEELQIVLAPGNPLVDPHRHPERMLPDGSKRTDLSDTPGLGHFRHALLEERHYDWSTEQHQSVEDLRIADPEIVFVELAGPPAQVVPTRIAIELSEGWVGPAGGGVRVRVEPRVQTALRHFIVTHKDINYDRAK